MPNEFEFNGATVAGAETRDDAPASNSQGLVVRVAGSVPVVGPIAVTGPLTNAELRATPVPVDVGANLNVIASFSDLVSAGNSYDGPLAANQVFTGVWEPTSGFAAIVASILTDQYSAINGAVAQFSDDGVSVLTYAASTVAPLVSGVSFVFAPVAAYFRIIYTNGATPATVNSHVVYKFNSPAVTQTALGAPLSDLNNAQITRAMVTGRLASGLWKSIESTALGELLVAGPVTDAELRASAIPVSGPLTDAQLRATPVPVSGPVTDAELRATAVPVIATIPALASWQSSQVSVGLVATQVAVTPLASRKTISLKAVCLIGETIFIGASNAVTVLTGYGLRNGETIDLDLDATAQVWAISASPGTVLYISEIA